VVDAKDIRVLSALTADPLGSYASLGAKAGLSASGLLKRVRDLVKDGFLDEKYVRAQVAYTALGLEQVLVMVESKPQFWKLVEDACDAHPYTQFRIRMMGKVNGFLLMFAIPQNSRQLLLEFIDQLRRVGAITSFSIHYPIANWGHSETRFGYFDPNSKKWSFGWDEWEKWIASTSAELEKAPDSVLENLDETDIKILRLLSMDAKAERREIARAVGIADYELSRRLKALNEGGVFAHYRIIHETAILGILMTVVVKCKASLQYTGRFINSWERLPFQGSVCPLEDGFLLMVNMPPKEVPTLFTILQRHCDSVDMMWGDYDSSTRYFFDNDPSNFSGSKWTDDRRSMVDEPSKVVQVSREIQA